MCESEQFKDDEKEREIGCSEVNMNKKSWKRCPSSEPLTFSKECKHESSDDEWIPEQNEDEERTKEKRLSK